MEQFSDLPALSTSKQGRVTRLPYNFPPENSDVVADPAFDIASLAVDTHICDLAAEHDHYLYGSPKP